VLFLLYILDNILAEVRCKQTILQYGFANVGVDGREWIIEKDDLGLRVYHSSQ